MAEKIIGNSGVINSADQYTVGNNGLNGGAKTIQLIASGWTGIIKVKARATRSGLAAASALLIPYTSLHLNGAVGTGALVSTDITTTSLIQIVVADGLDIILDCTSFTGGTMEVKVYNSQG